jgi:hypothetical protein
MDMPTHKIEAIMTPCYEKEVHEIARLYFDDRRGCMASFYITAIIRNAVLKIESVTCIADAPHLYYMNAVPHQASLGV